MFGFIFTVQENEEIVLTTFGRHSGSRAKPGINFKWPWQKKFAPVSKKVKEASTEIKTKTADNIFVTVPIIMHMHIEDAAKSVFIGSDPVQLVKDAVTDTVKGVISTSNLDELFSQRVAIREQVKEQVKDKISEYGYSLDNVIIEEPAVPKEVETRYNRAKSSEQELIERTNLAQANKIEIIAAAEAKKEATRLLGEGLALQRAALMANYATQIQSLKGSGLNEEEIVKILALAMTQDTLRDIGEHGNLIISTTNANATLAEFQALGRTMTNKIADNDNKTVIEPKVVTPSKPKR